MLIQPNPREIKIDSKSNVIAQPQKFAFKKLFKYIILYTERTILLKDLKFCWIQIWK